MLRHQTASGGVSRWRMSAALALALALPVAAQSGPGGGPNNQGDQPKVGQAQKDKAQAGRAARSEPAKSAPSQGRANQSPPPTARSARPLRLPDSALRPTPTDAIKTAPQVRQMDSWQTQVRQRNEQTPRPERVSPASLILRRPDGQSVQATVFSRAENRITDRDYARIRSRFGQPSFGCTFLPRPVSAFSLSEGRNHATNYWHRRPVFAFFYFSFYFDDPFYTGFRHPGYYPSIYCYYGWVPRWCTPPTVIVLRADPYPAGSYYYLYDAYPYAQLDTAGVYTALGDIRQAWLDAEVDRLAYYIATDQPIGIYFDGAYSYSLSSDDYYSMTLDAMSNLRTTAMEFDTPTWINANAVFCTGRHIFDDPDGQRQVVYVSYRLQRANERWRIVAVGSSPGPIQSPYRDFRDR